MPNDRLFTLATVRPHVTLSVLRPTTWAYLCVFILCLCNLCVFIVYLCVGVAVKSLNKELAQDLLIEIRVFYLFIFYLFNFFVKNIYFNDIKTPNIVKVIYLQVKLRIL